MSCSPSIQSKTTSTYREQCHFWILIVIHVFNLELQHRESRERDMKIDSFLWYLGMKGSSLLLFYIDDLTLFLLALALSASSSISPLPPLFNLLEFVCICKYSSLSLSLSLCVCVCVCVCVLCCVCAIGDLLYAFVDSWLLLASELNALLI